MPESNVRRNVALKRIFAKTELDVSYPEVERNRYRNGGNTIEGTTTPNLKYQVGAVQGIPTPTYARYATLMNVSGGNLYFGRNRAVGCAFLQNGDAYSFDYVDVSLILLLDNGTAVVWTIDYSGP